MENTAKYAARRIRTGLLICVLLLSVLPLSAQIAKWRNLVITPKSDYCFVGDLNSFILEIPSVSPDEVEVVVQSVPDEITVVSLSKEVYLKNDVRGTRVTFQIRFSETGTYHIPAIAANIAWYWINIPFGTVTVYENPMTVVPKVVINVPDTARQGEPFDLVISAMHFAEITDVAVALDTEAMIQRKSLSVDLPFSIERFSADTYPVAVYEVIPYNEGTYEVPEVSLSVKALSGVRSIVTSRQKTVKILPSDAERTETAAPGFDVAYVQLPEEGDDEQVVLHHSAAEQAQKLREDRERYRLLMWACLLVTAAWTLMLLIGAIRKNRSMVIIGLCGILLSLSGFTFFLCQACSSHVVSKGGELRLIPETAGNVLQLTQEGTVLRVNDVSALWYQVSTESGISGWILKEDCITIDSVPAAETVGRGE